MDRVVMLGIDHASNQIDFAKAKAAGYEFTMRYLPPNSCQISATEAQAALGAGLALGLIWQIEADRSLRGRPQGEQDGLQARQAATALGAPSWLRLAYVAADPIANWVPTDQQLRGPIAEYCRGFTASAGPSMPYGPYDVIEMICGVLQINPFGWQCAGGSGFGVGSGGGFQCRRDTPGTTRRLSAVAAMFQDFDPPMAQTDENTIFGTSPAATMDWAWGAGYPKPLHHRIEELMSRAVGSNATGDGQFVITPTSNGFVRVPIPSQDALAVLKRADVIETQDPLWLDGTEATWFASLPVGA